MKKIAAAAIAFIMSSMLCLAHEVRPAYLGITQVDDSSYQVIWKIPAMGEMVPVINPSFPESWQQSDIRSEKLDGAVRRQWTFVTRDPLNGNRIYIDGLSSTLIDVLVNIELQNDGNYSQIISADKPYYLIPDTSSIWDTILTYLVLGINHILLGIDHLLFVLALIIVTRGRWKILKTITAFTIAHSITLSLAALGFVRIPIAPVEAIIALSIVFLALEIIRHQEGKDSLTYRYPWIVAFTFGLLHGFGFASALSETGLPQHSIPAALAFFNIGVEIGQIVFVFVVLAIQAGIKNTGLIYPIWLKKGPVYLIGAVASFWVIERVLGFW